jgi:predicted dehydrogenase
MKKKKLRYAVVGLGHIAQVAVLPAFKEAKNSELVALVSDNSTKLKKLSQKYKVSHTYSYEQYDECLNSGNIDAVYIALPNHMHKEYVNRAAQAGIHVLCEKPLAVSSEDCNEMARVVRAAKIKFMVAYRLHFDPANREAIRIVNSGKIGEPRYFTSEFGYVLKKNNLRMSPKEGSGPLHDIGIYCINAARYLFEAEPVEVFAYGTSGDPSFSKIHETVTAILKFPKERTASFTCSFGSGAISNYRVVGTKGDLLIENVYEYEGELKHRLTVAEKKRKWTSKPGDQFAAEIEYFSDCILKNKNPEPSSYEGTADVKIIEALYESIRTKKSVRLRNLVPHKMPMRQAVIKKPAHREPALVKVHAPSN